MHEIGHILGLDHPDEHASQNFASERDEYNCSEPFKGVSMTSNYDANSVLRAQLVHDPKTCLTNDDLDGLNFLYPVCENRIQTPQCISNTLNLGWLRLALACLAAVFIPIIIVLVLKIYAKLMLRCSTRMRDKRWARMRMALAPNNVGAQGIQARRLTRPPLCIVRAAAPCALLHLCRSTMQVQPKRARGGKAKGAQCKGEPEADGVEGTLPQGWCRRHRRQLDQERFRRSKARSATGRRGHSVRANQAASRR